MTAFLIEYFKLIVLFAFIGSTIGLSNFNGGKTTPTRHKARRRTGARVLAAR